MLKHYSSNSQNIPHRSLIIIPPGGIGNRLMTIFNAIAICVIERFDYLIIKWNVNTECWANIDEIIRFKNLKVFLSSDALVDSINMSYNDQFIITNQDTSWVIKPKDTMMYGRGSTFYTGSPTESNTKDYEIINWIDRHVNKFVEFVKYEPYVTADIGLHCRRSDWGVSVNGMLAEEISSKRRLLDIEFEKFIRNDISGKRVFLSSDSQQSEEYFTTLHDNIIVHKKSRYPVKTFRDRDMTISSLTDLHTLAMCDTIIRDSNSTFSYVASLINGSKLITWDRPVLKEPGPGF